VLDALEMDLGTVKKGAAVVVTAEAYPKRQFPGRLITIMESIDPQVRTIKARAEIDNAEGLLKPNMYVTGYIEKAGLGEQLAIPSAALVKLQGTEGVFVGETDGWAFQPIEILDRDPAGFLFVAGLSELTRVVTKGASFLKAEWQLQRGQVDTAHGHTH
jgi:multidrug efflux pump subunit AcrA (membrane-fusion protein)